MDESIIRWRLHLAAGPEKVYHLLNSDEGRAGFWAESAVERNGVIHFSFPNGAAWQGKILQRVPGRLFRLIYYGGSTTTFELSPDGKGGTDLTLTDEGVGAEYQSEVNAGWVSVLMALKAAADHDIDLRNHDPERTWDQGYVDN